MTYRARTLTTAWLGLMAMWLIVFAPLVSQWVVAWQVQQPEAPLCSASLSSNGGDAGTHDHGLVACGYCDLLATHATMPPVPAVVVAFLAFIADAAAPMLSDRFTPPAPFPSGRPRAPPTLI